jgi:hypothetical protein
MMVSLALVPVTVRTPWKKLTVAGHSRASRASIPSEERVFTMCLAMMAGRSIIGYNTALAAGNRECEAIQPLV